MASLSQESTQGNADKGKGDSIIANAKKGISSSTPPSGNSSQLRIGKRPTRPYVEFCDAQKLQDVVEEYLEVRFHGSRRCHHNLISLSADRILPTPSLLPTSILVGLLSAFRSSTHSSPARSLTIHLPICLRQGLQRGLSQANELGPLCQCHRAHFTHISNY